MTTRPQQHGDPKHPGTPKGHPVPTEQPPMTPSLVKEHPADHDLGEAGHNEEERLDEALKETLPTSDPISIHIE